MCSKYFTTILISQCDYSSKKILRTAVLKFQMFISWTDLEKNHSNCIIPCNEVAQATVGAVGM